jgi:hypothetical protein
MKKTLVPIIVMLLLFAGAIVWVGARDDVQPKVQVDDLVIFEQSRGRSNESAVYHVTSGGVELVSDHPLQDVLEAGRNAAYAPNGGWVVFDSVHSDVFEEGDTEWEVPRIIKADLRGDSDPVIIGVGHNPHVSPDERRLVFLTSDQRIWIHDLETGESTETDYFHERYSKAVWVSNSELIFQRTHEDDPSLVRIDIDTNIETDLGAPDVIPQSVSPDKKYVACWRWRQSGIFLIDIATNEIEMIFRTRTGGIGYDYVWTSDSQGFYFHRESLLDDIFSGDGRNLYYCDLDRIEQIISKQFRFDSGVALSQSSSSP